MGAEQSRPVRPAPAGNRNGVQQVMRLGKRVGIALGGGAVTLAGAAMLVLPGPGVLTVALGFAILSLEFERPRVWLAQMKARGVQLKDRIVARRSQGRDSS